MSKAAMGRTFRFGWILAMMAPAALAWAGTGPAMPGGGAWMLVDPMNSGTSSGHSSSGYLGVDVRDVTQEELGALKLKDARGAEIVLVDHDAPAGKAGLRERDVVLQMNGQAITGREQISRMLHESPPGKTVVLLISRDGQQMTVSAQLSTRQEVDRDAWEHHLMAPDPDESESAEGVAVMGTTQSAPAVHEGNSFIGSILPSSSYTGAMLEKMPEQLADYFGAARGHGLLVSSVKADSPAAVAGLHAGDVVVRANEKAVASTGDWAKVIKSSHGQPVNVVVLRDKKERTLVLMPDGHKRSGLEFPVLQIQQAPAAIARIGLSWLPKS